MVNVHLIDVFNTKIVDNECEWDGPCFMVPQSWGINTFVIPERCQFLTESLVCKDASLWEAPHCNCISRWTHPSLACFLRSYCSIIHTGKRLSEFSCTQSIWVQQWDKKFDVKTHIFCTWRAHNTVPMQFCCVYICHANAPLSIICD